ncbi:aldehyde dehydrogenase family protein [Microbulbifer sp. 2201CG32-9]|uniref:aldehyde dehydrogenase family protein n=1 Tax=Microbulbifer sp. 2201CG32-9 TaxID=3232309 RepID=UPI00345C0C30
MGLAMSGDKRFPLVSATGSTAMGRSVGQTVGARLGRSLLELGGSNAMIVSETADLELALRAIVFSAVGTAGQRCTSLRRVIAHESVVERLLERLPRAYQSLPVGDPSATGSLVGSLVGSLIDQASFERMQATLRAAVAQGSEILYGGEWIHEQVPDGGYYVRPEIVRIAHDAVIVQAETFAPALYVMTYRDLAGG